MPRRGAARFLNSDLSILDHELIFWIGDLNYRINDELTTEEVFFKIESNNLDALRSKDQLNIEKINGNVFQGFDEGELTFPPTYKYQPGTDKYETRAEKKLRTPSWCDRILYKSIDSFNKKANLIKLHKYRRAMLNCSDHKPVSALFNCELKTVVESKEKTVFQEFMNILDKSTSNLKTPSVNVTGLKINIEKVNYEQKFESIIELKNTGDNVCHWHFVSKLEEIKFSKRWITFNAVSGLLLPDETFNIVLTVCVDKKTAHILNSGKDVIIINY